MPNEDKKTFTEKRQKRQQGRVGKLTEKRLEEAAQAGVDLDKPIDIGPMGSERKARIDEDMRKGVSEDLLGGLKKIQAVRSAPEVDVAEKPSIDLDIKDVRKERRNKIANILNAFGQGLAGEKVDPFMYTRPHKEARLSQYQQYKDTSQAAKQRQEEWESAYIDEQLDYLNDKTNNPKTTPLEKVELEKAIADLAMKKQQLVNLRKGKGDDVPKAKYVTKLDDDKSITRSIPIEEAKQREREAALSEATQQVDLELQQSKLDLANMGEKWTPGSGAFYVRNKANLENKIVQLEQQRQEIVDELEGNTPTPTPEPTPTGNPARDILNKNKKQ